MKPISQTIINYLARYFELQLFLMALSLPVLVGWGMPLTPLGLIGNIVFTPFLLLFLTLSSLIFITEICSVNNLYLVRALEAIDIVWHQCMAWAPQHLIVPVANPGWVLLVIAILGVIVCAHTIRRYRRIIRIGLFVSMLSLMILGLKIITYFTLPTIITIDRQRWYLTHDINRSWLYIPSLSCGRIPAYQFVHYRVIPALIKQTGLLSFDVVIISVRNREAESVVNELLSAIDAQTCIILYQQVSDAAHASQEERYSNCIRVGTLPFSHQIDAEHMLVIRKKDPVSSLKHRLIISRLIDNTAHTLYDA